MLPAIADALISSPSEKNSTVIKYGGRNFLVGAYLISSMSIILAYVSIPKNLANNFLKTGDLGKEDTV